jgi:hypothetical protein
MSKRLIGQMASAITAKLELPPSSGAAADAVLGASAACSASSKRNA